MYDAVRHNTTFCALKRIAPSVSLTGFLQLTTSKHNKHCSVRCAETMPYCFAAFPSNFICSATPLAATLSERQ